MNENELPMVRLAQSGNLGEEPIQKTQLSSRCLECHHLLGHIQSLWSHHMTGYSAVPDILVENENQPTMQKQDDLYFMILYKQSYVF